MQSIDTIEGSETLEAALEKAQGDPDRTFTVTNGDAVIGTLDMRDVMRAIVPRKLRGQRQKADECRMLSQSDTVVRSAA
jgi:glycine betaine/proline transport system ATP-binding protein